MFQDLTSSDLYNHILSQIVYFVYWSGQGTNHIHPLNCLSFYYGVKDLPN